MNALRALRAALAGGGASVAAAAASAQAEPYTYVKMSLGVPWTLYFIFLACVLIPFVVMIGLAWRQAARRAQETAPAAADAPAVQTTAGAAPGDPGKAPSREAA
jgi:hypothetical protein